MKNVFSKFLTTLLCFNLLVNSFLPLIVYAQDFNPGGGEGGEVPQEPAQVCTEVYRYNECNWEAKQVYEVYQNGCTGEWIRKNYRQEEGQCGYSSQPNFDAAIQAEGESGGGQSTPQCQEEVVDWCAKKECDPNIDNGRLVCFKEVRKADCSTNLEVNNATDEKCGAALTAQILLDSGGSDPVSYYGGAVPATIQPSEVAPEESVAPTPTPQPPSVNTWDPGYPTEWGSTIETPIVTDEAAQGAAMQAYYDSVQAEQARAEQIMSQARSEDVVNLSQTPDYLALAAAGAWDSLGEEVARIRSNLATPAPFYDLEAELAKAQKQAQEQAEIEKQRKDALAAAMNLSSEQRIAALNASMGLSQDTPPAQTLSYFNGAAKSLGVKIDVWEDGSYTVSLDQPSEATSLTYTPYVPGSSFAPASISASSTIDPKPFCDHIKDPVEKDKCQNEWRTIAVGGTVAVTAAGAAIVSAPVWLPAAGAGLSTAATIINSGTTAMYVYPTVAGGVLLSRSPAIVQQGIGVLAQASSVVIPAAVWASCQTQDNPVDCVSRDLGIADLPMVLAEGTKAVKTATKVQGGVEVAAQKAIDLIDPKGMIKRQGNFASFKRIFSEKMWREEGFNLSEELSHTKGPMIEIAGPTDYGFDLGYDRIKLDELQDKVHVSNIYNGVPIFQEGIEGPVRFEGKVDFQADGTRLPVRDESLGAVFASCFPDAQMCGGTMESGYRNLALDEAFRKLKEDGLLIWQAGGIGNDIQYAQELGFKIVQSYKKSPDGPINVVFRKVTKPTASDILDGLYGPVYIPPANQPRNVTVQSITDEMRFNDRDIKDINAGAGALAQVYPGTEYGVLSTKGSTAVIFEKPEDPSKVYKVYRQGTENEWDYANVEVDNLRRLSEAGLSPRLYEYHGQGDSPLPVVVMGKIDFIEDGIKKLQADRMEAEIVRLTKGFESLNVSFGDAEFVVDKTSGRLIMIDVGSVTPLDETGRAFNNTPAEAVRDEIEGTFFGRYFFDLKQYKNPAEGLARVREEMQELGFSEERIRNEMFSRYKRLAMLRNRTTGETALSVFGPPFNRDAGGLLLNLADNVAQGVSEAQLQQLVNSLSAKNFSQEAIDGAIEAGRQVQTAAVGAVKGVFTQASGGLGSISATDYDPTKIMKADEYEALAKKDLIKKKLQDKGKIDSKEVLSILESNILEPRTKELSSGEELLVTGKTGIVEGEAERSKYLVKIFAIPQLDIKIPSYVDLSAGDVTLGIAVKEGSGKVEQIGYIKGQGQTNNQAKVKVVVFADNNGNGVIDNEEKALPWAGVSVKLTKVNEENTVNLNAGWNLVSLTSLPEKALTASTLLSEISKQGGEATTVSTLVDGAWKSYVKRGESDYSMDDFAIEVGKSYFIKALKPSTFKYSGQNLVAPIKVKVQSGWNAVGFPKTSKEYKASSLIDDIVKESSASGTLSWWDFGLWDTFVKRQAQQYGNNFNILPGFGYILKVEKEAEVTP